MNRRLRLSFALGQIVGTLALLVLLAPLFLSILMSFAPGELLELPGPRWSLRWYVQLAGDRRWRDSLATSLEVAALSALIAVLSGTSLGLSLCRARFRGARLLSGLALAPLFVPPLVLGMGMLPLLHFLGIRGNRWSLALAHGLTSLPVVYLIVRSALRAVSPDLELAARGLGAGPLQTFRYVTWPLIRPAVGVAGLFSFLLSFNEFILALFLTTAESETLPRVIWPELRYSLRPLVASASVVSMALTLMLFALAVVLWNLSRRLLGVDADR